MAKKSSPHPSSNKSHRSSSSSSRTIRAEGSHAHDMPDLLTLYAQHLGQDEGEDGDYHPMTRYERDLDKREHFFNHNQSYPFPGSTTYEGDAERTIQYFNHDWAHASSHDNHNHSRSSEYNSNRDSRQGAHDGHHSAYNHHGSHDHSSDASGSGSGSSSGRHRYPYTERYYYPHGTGEREPRSHHGKSSGGGSSSSKTHKSRRSDKDHKDRR